MTLKLWRGLHNPPATHPIFVRNVLLPTPQISTRRIFNSARALIGFILLMSDFMPTLLIVVMPFILAASGFIYGLDCALRVCYQIAQERKNHTYQLLALSPVGALPVCWVICTSVLHQRQHFTRLSEIVRISVQIGLAGIAIVMVLLGGISGIIAVTRSQLAPPDLLPLIHMGAVVIVIYGEFVQSTVIGCLVGLMVPTVTDGTMDSLLYSPALFLLVKFISWAIGLGLIFGIFDPLYIQLALPVGLLDTLMTVTRVMILIIVQNGSIRLLWWVIVKRTDPSIMGVEWVTGQG